MLFHANFSIMIHTVSIWLTLSLAVWRFLKTFKQLNSKISPANNNNNKNNNNDNKSKQQASWSTPSLSGSLSPSQCGGSYKNITNKHQNFTSKQQKVETTNPDTKHHDLHRLHLAHSLPCSVEVPQTIKHHNITIKQQQQKQQTKTNNTHHDPHSLYLAHPFPRRVEVPTNEQKQESW